MTGKIGIAAMVAVGLLAGVVVALFSMNRDDPEVTPLSGGPLTETPFEATLFLPDENLRHLTRQTETLSSSPTMVDRIARLINALTDPARSKGLFPDGMTPLHLFVNDQTVVVGYGAEFGARFAGGAADELMGIDALVNSIVRTFDEIEQVRIVRPGEAPFIRHVDLSQAFRFSAQFVAPASVESGTTEAVPPRTAEAKE